MLAENLDELQEMAEEMFSGVKNKNVETPEWPDHPFGPEQLQMRGFVVPVKDLRSLNVTFPIPDMRNYYKSAVSIHNTIQYRTKFK
jgi:insulysin